MFSKVGEDSIYAVVRKPFDINTLLATIPECMESHRK
jgi:hypothetical protein